MTLSIDTIIMADVSDEQEKLSKESSGVMFGDLKGSAIGYGNDRMGWELFIRIHEDSWMESKNFGSEAKKKDGTWKYRTYLPMAWSSAKSVLGNALANDIDITGDISKSEIERKLREHKRALQPEKSDIVKFDIVMETAKKIYDKLSDEEKRHARDSHSLNWFL